MHQRERWLAVAAASAMFGVVLLNALLRADGRAACVGLWPLCENQWFAPLTRLDWVSATLHSVSVLAWPLLVGNALMAWSKYRAVRWVLWPAWAAFGLLVLQFLFGLLPAQTWLAIGHNLLGQAALALLVLQTTVMFQLQRNPRIGDSLLHFDAVSGVAGAAALAVFVLLGVGGAVVLYGARVACLEWPVCEPTSFLGWLSLTHRLVALIAGLLVLGGFIYAWQLRRENSPVLVAASVTAALYAGQSLISAANVLNGFPLRLNSLHAGTAVAVWVAMVVFAVLAMQHVKFAPLKVARPMWNFSRAQLRSALADYLILTKPIIMVLLLVTTGAAMIVAGHDWPPLDLFLWTMLGGGLASGGASALNQVIDHHLDQHMARTSRRPIAQGRVSVAEGLAYGLILNILSFYTLSTFVNQAAAFWAMAGSAYYVVGYTVLLKKTTVQNIVIGGGAGAIPPLVGWAAVSGGVGLPAFFLFALIFFWTPPHFWALSLLKKNDYARAGVPMMPVVWGEAETRRQIFLYTLVLVALTLLFTPAGVAGVVYLVGATVLGGAFIVLAMRLWRTPDNKTAFRLYKYSSYYLALMFALLVIDRFYFINL
jgi:protoheme IX farnesyltransferase